MSLFEVKPYDREVYEKELKDFLPQKILDVHTHVYLKEFFPPKPLAPGEVKRTVTWPSLVAADDSIEDLQETYRLMLPGKDVTALMFSNSGRSQQANDYVADASRRSGFPALYFSAPEESPEEVERQIRKGGFLGIKGYLSLSPKYIPEAEIRIFDFFPKAQLKKMDELGAIVMLHIPRNGRLKDPVNLAQIMEIKQEFPNIRLIIAHIGRAYTKEDVGNAFETLDQAPDLMYDFCANCCEYAITRASSTSCTARTCPSCACAPAASRKTAPTSTSFPPDSTVTRSRTSTCVRSRRRRRRRSRSSCMRSCWRSSAQPRRWGFPVRTSKISCTTTRTT